VAGVRVRAIMSRECGPRRGRPRRRKVLVLAILSVPKLVAALRAKRVNERIA
jgi:hypothetical protein